MKETVRTDGEALEVSIVVEQKRSVIEKIAGGIAQTGRVDTRKRGRARWIGALLLVAGVALNLYASALSAFQMGGSCREFGFTVPDWNCRQASFYGLFSVLMFVAGIAAIGISFMRRGR